MPLQNPSNLYSGAAQEVSRNVSPHIQFQVRLFQQQQAKEEALDSYYRKLPLTINEKGVRDQERPLIAEGFNKLKDYYLQNKGKIKKGDQAAIYNYEKMIREQKDIVGTSQSLGMTGLQLGKMKYNPKTGYIFQHKNIVPQIEAHEYPLNDPRHKAIDLEILTLPPKPHDPKEYFKGIQIKGNDSLTVVDNNDGTETVINTPTYGQKQKDYLVSVAADKYLHDEGFKEFVETELGVPDKTNPLNETFRQYFQEDIQTPIDLATAYTLSGLRPEPIKQKRQIDSLDMLKRRQKFAQEQQARGFANTRANMIWRFNHQPSSGNSADDPNNDVLGFYEENFGEVVPQKEETGVPIIGRPQQGYKFVEASTIDPAHLKVITNDAVFPKTLPNGKKGFEVDQNGDWVAANGQRIDRVSVKTRFAKFKTKSFKNDKIGNQQSTTKPATPSKSASGVKWK